MKTLAAGMMTFAATFLVGAVLTALWVTGGTGRRLELRVSLGKPVGATGQGVPEQVVGELKAFDGKPADLRGSWPGFRGPNRDGVSDDFTELARSWPAGGPKRLWELELGEGFAGCAVMGGRIYLQDYDARRKRELIRCLSLADGKDIWEYGYKMPIKRSHGYSRTVPAVTDKHVVVMGAKCHVSCLDANSGRLLWDISLVRDYGTTIPTWYAGQCPLIDDGNAILAPCGKVVRAEDANGQTVARGRNVLMMAVRCDSGQVAWEVPNDDGWDMTHSCVAVMELEDYTRTYVYCGSGGVVGVSAKDGRVLWKNTEWTVSSATVPMPVPVGENKVFLCGGYGAGCMMLQVVREGDRYAAQTLWRKGPNVFGSSQQTPIFYKSHLFGTRTDGQFTCLSGRGEVVWASGAGEKYGKDGGAYLVADDLLFVLDDDGVMTLMKATPAAYSPLTRAKVLPGLHSWAPMALVSGRLLARDETRLVCFDVSKKANPPAGAEAEP